MSVSHGAAIQRSTGITDILLKEACLTEDGTEKPSCMNV